MKELDKMSGQIPADSKKEYTKPVLNIIQLVAEEAVLALCKVTPGTQSTCMPTPTCHPRIASS